MLNTCLRGRGDDALITPDQRLRCALQSRIGGESPARAVG